MALSAFIRTFAAMRNLLRLLWLALTAPRPAKIGQMRAVLGGMLLPRSYAAMTFFGSILAHTQEEVDSINARPSILLNHEMIHLRQAQSVHNSWFCFYILYIWYYLRALPQNRHMRNAAYYLNPFEMEAYEHEYDRNYLEGCTKGANGWRSYAKMTPKERRILSKS